MSKSKRPVYEYVIDKYTKKNVHTDAVEIESYRVNIRSKGWLSQWHFLSNKYHACKFSNLSEDSRKYEGFFFDSLEEAKKAVIEFTKIIRKDFESETYYTIVPCDKGIINV